VVYFLEDEETLTKVPSMLPLLFGTVKSPRVPVTLENQKVTVLLDTGAEVTVIPKTLMQQLIGNGSKHARLGQTKFVRPFANPDVQLEGPWGLTVEIFGVRLIHPIYSMDADIPAVVGIDLLTAAKVVIDVMNRCVYSHHHARLEIELGRTNYEPVFKVVNAAQFQPSLTSFPAPCSASSGTPSDSQDLGDPSSSPGAGAFLTSLHSAEALVRPFPAPVPPAPQLITEDSPTQDDVFLTSCADLHQPLQPPPLSFPLSPTAPSFYPPASVPHHHPLVQDLSAPSSTPVQLSMTSLSSLPSNRRPPDIVLQPPPPPVPPDPPAPPPDPPDPPDLSPLLQDHVTPRSCPSLPLSPADHDDASETLLKMTSSELPQHVNLLFIQTVESPQFSTQVRQGLRDLLSDHADTFARDSKDLGFCNVLQHDIDTGDARPIEQSPRRPPLAACSAEDQILDEMLESGVIEPSCSLWASPVCLVKKKEGTYRFCVDYRRVNSVSNKDAFPIPDIQDAIDHLRGAKYFATFDLLSGYWQLGLTERAKERSAICTRRDLYQFTRMPFGLAGAPSSFCRLMSIVLRDLLYKVCLCYLDDIIIFARTPEELLERLRTVLNRLKEVGLKLKPSKCALFQTQIHFLGHLISEHGVDPQPDKIKAIQEWPRPRCVKEVCAFYDLASYYRKFVKGFATIAEPLTKLTKKNVRFEWSDEAQTAFDTLKQALQDATSLAYPHPNIPCIVDSEASDVAIGAVLSQVIDGVERPIVFFSKVMNATQRNYCLTRRELLAVIAALQHFRHYLLGNKVVLRTDHHSLKWLNTFKRPEGIMARWVETLAEFDFTIEHRPGRLHCNADGVSRPICKQCYGKTTKTPWVDELDHAVELTEPLGLGALFWAPEHSAEDIVALQAEDEDLAPVLDWLETDHVPDADELRSHSLITRTLWSQKAELEFRENVLVRVLPDRTQLVVPQTIRKALFDQTHSGPLAAHLGAEKTLAQLKQHYFWPQMRKDVETWYRQCVDCARGQGSPKRPHGKLKKVIVGEPLDVDAIDILSGLPSNPENFKYILVVTDYFTKWSEAYALKDAEAPT